MLKSCWFKLLLALLLLWMILTAYFYYHRQVTVAEQSLNEKLSAGDCQLVFEEMSFRNFTYTYDTPFLNHYLSLCPPLLQERVKGITDYYHKPVEFTYDTGTLELKGMAIYPEYQKDCSKWINLMDVYILGYESAAGSIYDSNSNYLRFNVHVREFPRQDLDKELHIWVKDKTSGESKSINIMPQWREQKYNLLEKRPLKDLVNPGEIARNFLDLGEAGNRQEALDMVVADRRQDFPWPFTGDWNWEDNSQIHYFIQQHDNYEGFKDVYSLKIEKMSNNDGSLTIECEQTVFLLLDNDEQWQVIDISSFRGRSE